MFPGILCPMRDHALTIDIPSQGGRGPRYICSWSKYRKFGDPVHIAKPPVLIGLLDVIHHLSAHEFLGEPVYQFWKE